MKNMQAKHDHRDELVRIGILAIEHALRFLPENNPSHALVLDRLKALHNHDTGPTKEMIRQAQPETEYSQQGCLRRASVELLKLSVSEKYLSSSALTTAVFVPCWDAGSFVGRGQEMQTEMEFQNKDLYPMIERAFEKLRNPAA